MQDLQAACARCGAANHGTKFCPECGAPAAAGSPVNHEQPAAGGTAASGTSPPADESLAADLNGSAAGEGGASSGDPTLPDNARIKPLRRVPAGRPPAAAAPAAVASGGRRLKVWAGVACLLAVIGIAAGAVGIIQALNAEHATSSLRAQLTALRHRVGGDETRVSQEMATVPGRATMAAAQSSIAAAQSSIAAVQRQLAGQDKSLTAIQGQDTTYTSCIPELQTELNGLTISWSINTINLSQSSFGINNGSQISHDCTKLLYGG